MKILPERKITVCDAVTVTFVLLLCLGMWMMSARTERGDFFTVQTENGRETYSLGEERTFDVVSHGVCLTVSVKDGAVKVVSSDCPDGICTSTGAISRPGESIVCVPAMVVIAVVNGEGEVVGNGEADFIVG